MCFDISEGNAIEFDYIYSDFPEADHCTKKGLKSFK